jgi:nucleoside-diphosphate-sugar epimerase
MLDNTIAAAQANGARIVLPGTIYSFGPDAFPNLHGARRKTPSPPKVKFAPRWRRALALRDRQDAKVLIVRAGDFFGRSVANNWFSQALVKPGRPVSTITNAGAPGIGHQRSYLPDLAETIGRLLERSADLEGFAHREGHWDADGTQMIDDDSEERRQSANQGCQDAVEADAALITVCAFVSGAR